MRARGERNRIEQGIAEADVHDPDTVGRLRRWQAVHGEPEVVGDPAGRPGSASRWTAATCHRTSYPSAVSRAAKAPLLWKQ